MGVNGEQIYIIYTTLAILVLIGLLFIPFLFAEYYHSNKYKCLLFVIMIVFSFWRFYTNVLPTPSVKNKVLIEMILIFIIPYLHILKCFLNNYMGKESKFKYYLYFSIIHFILWMYMY